MSPAHHHSAPGSAGSKIVGLGHFRPDRVVTNDDLSPRSWTPTTSGSGARVGIAERRFAGRGRHGRVDGRQRRREGARRGRAAPRRHRHRHRGHLHAWRRRSRTRPPRSPARWASTRPARSTSTPPAPDSATALAAADQAVRSGSSQERAASSGSEKLTVLDRPGRSGDRDHLRRRRRRRGGHARPTSRADRPGGLGQRREDHTDAIRHRGPQRLRSSSRRARPSSAGPPPRSRPVAIRAAEAAGVALADIDVLATTRPTCGSSTRSPRS